MAENIISAVIYVDEQRPSTIDDFVPLTKRESSARKT